MPALLILSTYRHPATRENRSVCAIEPKVWIIQRISNKNCFSSLFYFLLEYWLLEFHSLLKQSSLKCSKRSLKELPSLLPTSNLHLLCHPLELACSILILCHPLPRQRASMLNPHLKAEGSTLQCPSAADSTNSIWVVKNCPMSICNCEELSNVDVQSDSLPSSKFNFLNLGLLLASSWNLQSSGLDATSHRCCCSSQSTTLPPIRNI